MKRNARVSGIVWNFVKPNLWKVLIFLLLWVLAITIGYDVSWCPEGTNVCVGGPYEEKFSPFFFPFDSYEWTIATYFWWYILASIIYAITHFVAMKTNQQSVLKIMEIEVKDILEWLRNLKGSQKGAIVGFCFSMVLFYLWSLNLLFRSDSSLLEVVIILLFVAFSFLYIIVFTVGSGIFGQEYLLLVIVATFLSMIFYTKIGAIIGGRLDKKQKKSGKKKTAKPILVEFPLGEIKRQGFHLAAGVVLVFLLNANILQLYHLVLILMLGFVVSLLSRKYKMPGIQWFLHHFDRGGKLPGHGALTLLLGSIIALTLFSRNVALASIMVLALGDSLSHLGRFGSIRHPFNKTRFLEGTAIGIVAGTLGALYFVPFSAAFFGSLAAMIAESFDLRVSKVKIDDNLLIPLVAGLVMSLVVLNISYAPAFSHPSSFQTIPTTEETEKIALSDTEKFNINECIERRIMPKETNKITTRALLNIFGNRTPSDCPKEILSSFPTQDKIDACTYSKGIVGDEEIVLWIAREYIFLERNRSGNKTFYQPTYQTIEVNRSMGISHADIEMYPWGEISPFCLAEEEHPYLRLSENYSEDYSLSLEKIGDDIYAKIGIDHMIGVEGCLMSGQGYFGLTTSESKFNLSARLVPPFSINACNLMEQQDRDKCTCVFALYQEGGTWIDYLPDSLNMVGNINDVDLRNECEEEVRKTWEAMENRDEIIRPEKFQAMEKEIKPKLEDTYIRNVLCGEFCKDGTCLGNPPAGRGVCTVPEEEMLIGYETEICKGTYNLTAGIKVAVDGTDIDCKGATLVGNGTGIGIDVNAYRNVTIRNCNISNFDIGISTAGSNTLLENNSIENSKNGGISANGANSISIFNNTLSQNSGTSIKLSKVVTGKITNNTVSTTFYDESGFGGIFIENSNGIILQHNEIINNDIGTQITDSEGVLIYENIFENNGIGLTMDALYSEVSNNSIRKNKFRYNRDIGMYLFRASENSFLENEFYGTGIEEQIINETMYTNIFCSVNITNYYYDGAYGPSCGPKIEILFPKEGVNEGDFEDVVVITDRIAECKYSMTKEYPDGNLKSLGGKLGSEDGIRHTIVIILSPKGHKDRVEVTCVDSSGNDSKNSVTFSSR